jgi:DMSO/TMAO reductase YedYZ molybdopterin-dependent catalytic subunit
MDNPLMSRREWLALMAAVPLSASLAGCAPQREQAGDSSGGGVGDGDAGSSGVGSSSFSDTKVEPSNELTSYEGVALDRIGTAKVQGIKGVQDIETAGYRFKVSGLVGEELSLTYEEVRALSLTRTLVTLPCVEGWSAVHVWDGVLVSELLKKAKVDPAATTLIFQCADNYSTSLPLTVALTSDVLLAWALNGVTLPKEFGYPLRTVAQHRLGYKWAKWIEGITIIDKGHKGYWEQRGYDNDAATAR